MKKIEIGAAMLTLLAGVAAVSGTLYWNLQAMPFCRAAASLHALHVNGTIEGGFLKPSTGLDSGLDMDALLDENGDLDLTNPFWPSHLDCAGYYWTFWTADEEELDKVLLGNFPQETVDLYWSVKG